MPSSKHTERHFSGSETIRDIVFGMSDGLTVPFALAAGLSSASARTAIIIAAGLSEIAAGSISMGLGGFLAARSDLEHYHSEKAREEREVEEVPEIERSEVREILEKNYGLTPQESEPMVDALSRRKPAWVEFMMRLELGLESPNPRRALLSALTIAGAYIVGGLVPLSPYFFIPRTSEALKTSAGVTLLTLLVFGYIKGRYTGAKPLRSAVQTMLIGGVAATAAFFLARLVS